MGQSEKAEEIQKEDPRVTIQKLQNQLENFKLKMEDISVQIKKIEEEKKEQIRKNNEKINLVAGMVFNHMNELYEQVLEKLNRGGDAFNDQKIPEEMWKNTENTALNIIEDLKNFYNEGTSVLND